MWILFLLGGPSRLASEVRRLSEAVEASEASSLTATASESRRTTCFTIPVKCEEMRSVRKTRHPYLGRSSHRDRPRPLPQPHSPRQVRSRSCGASAPLLGAGAKLWVSYFYFTSTQAEVDVPQQVAATGPPRTEYGCLISAVFLPGAF